MSGENEELYTLVTDEGYAKTPDIVWENLVSIEGDSFFMMGSFQRYEPPATFLGFSLGGGTTDATTAPNEDTE
jgi:hypothetical protein